MLSNMSLTHTQSLYCLWTLCQTSWIWPGLTHKGCVVCEHYVKHHEYSQASRTQRLCVLWTLCQTLWIRQGLTQTKAVCSVNTLSNIMNTARPHAHKGCVFCEHSVKHHEYDQASHTEAIFVVLIMWHKQSYQHQENGTTALPAGCSPCKNVLLGLLPSQQGVVPWDYALVLAGHPPS